MSLVPSFPSSGFVSDSRLLKVRLVVSDAFSLSVASQLKGKPEFRAALQLRGKPEFCAKAAHPLSRVARTQSHWFHVIKTRRITHADGTAISTKMDAKYAEMILKSRVNRFSMNSSKEFEAERVDTVAYEHTLTPSNVSRNLFPMVKMCGITNVDDAVSAVEAGAKYVGMILWPNSKRSVSLHLAKIIADTVKELGADSVGVFVDEDARTIENICARTGIVFAQLHGARARSALLDLSSSINVIYVLHADKKGIIQTALPPRGEVDWILVDSLGGGSGKKFDWMNFKVPEVESKNGWILAGGLDPQNVGAAISILKPDVVDVSSGITGPDGIIKDRLQIVAFMNAMRTWN